MKKSVDHFIEELYSEDIKLKITVKDDYIFIDGSGKSLKWLSKIIGKYSEQDFEDAYRLHPKGPGSIYYKKGSTHGIYLYNTDNRKKKK
jgi:hypothetical protein